MAGLGWKSLTSPTHAIIKHLVKVSTRAQYRKAHGRCVVSGSDLITEVISLRGTFPQTVLRLADSDLPPAFETALENVPPTVLDKTALYSVTAPMLRKLALLESVTKSVATVVAEFAVPDHVRYMRNSTVEADANARDSQLNEPSAERSRGPLQLYGRPRVLLLDAVSDPGNVGTLLRTGLALGFDTAVLLEGCCDPVSRFSAM